MTTFQLYRGDAAQVLRGMAANSVDSVVCDPPYGISFMNKHWDYDIPSVETWREVFRVLKPGGHVLSFAGTRTQHRMAAAIEDAGFEIREMLAWVYGSGMPKNKNLGNGFGSSLKPALEPITVARKPFAGSLTANFEKYGTGGINIEGCRVPLTGGADAAAFENNHRVTERLPQSYDGQSLGLHDGGWKQRVGEAVIPPGRWPANLIHDGSDEVLAAFPNAPGQQAATGKRKQGGVYGAVTDGQQGVEPRNDGGSAARFFKQIDFQDEEWLKNLLPALTAGTNLSLQNLADAIARSDAATSALPEASVLSVVRAPSTSVTLSESKLIATAVITMIRSIASAYLLGRLQEKLTLSLSRVSVVAQRTQTGTTMITANLSTSAGSVESIIFSTMPSSSEAGEKGFGPLSGSRIRYCTKASKKDRGEGNNHVTVKPTDLMRYLCRLVTPPNGTVLDPWAGSGSTGKAAILEGFHFVGIDLDSDKDGNSLGYLDIARSRILAVGGIEIGRAEPAPALSRLLSALRGNAVAVESTNGGGEDEL